MTLPVEYAWLLAGVFFLLMEAFGMPGMGMLFAGMGAWITGAALYFHLIADEDILAQGLVFFASTAACAAVLWKPLRRLRLKKNGYSNIVGDTAVVGNAGLTAQHGGEVTWSGTIMKARLAPGVMTTRLEPGEPVVIVEMNGATLIVKPKE